MNYIVSIYKQDKNTLESSLIKSFELDPTIFTVSSNYRQTTTQDVVIVVGIERLVTEFDGTLTEIFNTCSLKDANNIYKLSVGTTDSVENSMLSLKAIGAMNLDTNVRPYLNSDFVQEKSLMERLEFHIDD